MVAHAFLTLPAPAWKQAQQAIEGEALRLDPIPGHVLHAGLGNAQVTGMAVALDERIVSDDS